MNELPARRSLGESGLLSNDLSLLFKVLAALGVVAVIVGLFVAPQRVWPNLLLVSLYVLGMGLAGLVFVALQYVTGATWSIALRRVAEALTIFIPTGAIGLFAVLVAQPQLYSWAAPGHLSAEGPQWFRHFWLSRPFFLTRSLAYVVIWTLFAAAIVRNSQRQDQDASPAHTQSNARLSAAFLAAFGVTFWLASFDWVMSLEPHWYSTLFGIYSFAGLFLGGIAAIIVLVVALMKLGPLDGVINQHHLHDLGKLLFAFSTFWAYIWFCQYMLIWYADIPEETVYYVRRLHGAWMPLFLLNFALNWVLPFLALLPRVTKRTPGLLVKVAVVVLLGRWLDLYLMVLPTFLGRRPAFGAWEFGPMLGAFGLCALIYFHALRKAPIVPQGDPCLAESLHHQQ